MARPNQSNAKPTSSAVASPDLVFQTLERKGGGVRNLCAVPRSLAEIQVHRTEQEVAPESVGMTRAGVESIWRGVEEIYRTGTHPGISFCLRREGRIVLHRAIGHARGNGPRDSIDTPKLPMLPETPVCYFSASKAVTAVLTHFLVEDKLIHLHDPVSHYLPEFGRKGKRNITIHQVLSHRSGVPGIPPGTNPEKLWDHEWIWNMICNKAPSSMHGNRLEYHAVTGGYVLQRVLEKVTGSPLREYLDRRIRKPMGMTYFDYGLAPEAADLVSESYATGVNPFFPVSLMIRRALGASLDVVEAVINNPKFRDVVIAAANIFGTAEEMSRFYQMLLDQGMWEGRRICEAVTVRRIIQEYAATQFDRTLFLPMRYSAGLMLGNEPFGMWGKSSSHAFGHIGLINKLGWADPSRKISVCMMNTGIPFISSHYMSFVRFMSRIDRHVPRDGGL
jgi:CubicO group peptidase (beta-lactamase class C family)